MKKSHRAIIDAMRAGAFLSRNRYSYKTQFLKMPTDQFWQGKPVRNATIEEMQSLGLLTLQVVNGSSVLRPNENLHLSQ